MGKQFGMRQLGKTGLQVSPLGIGAGIGISSEDVLYAFEHGINYFFFSSDLHHATYQHSARALRELCRCGSTVREQVVLATVTYINDPEKLTAILIDQLNELKVDYIDIFHWGWVTDSTNMLPLLKGSHKLKGSSTGHQSIRQLCQVTAEVNTELLRRGLVRYVGASFHSRTQARAWMRNLDVLMLRYNIAHLGMEQDIVPFLYGDKNQDPGIVVFNSAHDKMGALHIPPPGYAMNQYVPSIPDCYRFALTNPWVDLVLTGLRNRKEVDLALAALEQGPLSPEEYLRMREYGALYTTETSALSA
jgi:aryl-alcohol dehydrogenase-like predicted oxidoreductase